jgi:CelD/BcsL family acetyltransferase involved in cellulose biosynthesis
MATVVVHPKELDEAQTRRWTGILRAEPTLASPFLTARFTQVVGAFRDDARVAVTDDGFFAFQVQPDASGVPIGASIGDAQAVIAREELDLDARDLIGACGLSSWSFDHLVPSQAAFEPFHVAMHTSPVIDSTSGVDAYLAAVRARSRDVLTQVARRRRKLEREVGALRCVWSSHDPSHLTTLLGWKSDQYTRTGVWNRFAYPWIEGVVRTLAERDDDPELQGVLTTMRAGDRLVAAHLGLRCRQRLSWWFPAYDPELSRYSPGLILLIDLVRLAHEQGVRVIDLGRGEHHYKLRVANRTEHVAEGVVVV